MPWCVTCNHPLPAGESEFCDLDCAASYPALPDGKERYEFRPKDLAGEARRQAPPGELVAFYGAVWRGEAAELGMTDGVIPLATREKAAAWLTERGYGKTPVFAVVEGDDPLGLDDVDREISRLEDELATRREEKARGGPPGDALGGDSETGAATAGR
jgi:hypothetical protein